MPTSKYKSKPKKGGVNHLKPAFKSTDIYEKTRIELHLSQYQAFDDALTFFDPKNTSSHFMLLEGSAGTGKTYLAGKIAEYLQTVYFCNVLLCAPTNKAVKVLKSMQRNKKSFDFMTIHSALGMEEVIDDDGNTTFRNQKPEAVKIRNYDYIMLDEASMVDDSLFEKILVEITDTGVKILFVGDNYQIPPVDHDESAIFKADVQAKYNIKKSKLIAIIRQHHGNPIISFANQIKDALDNPKIISELRRKDEFRNISKIIFLPQDREPLLNVLNKFFLTSDFDNDADYCKVLAWSNKKVDKFNALIRKMKYGADAPQLVVGEKLIFDRPWTVHRRMLYGTNDEVTVRSFEEGSMDLFDKTFYYYDTVVSREGAEEIEKQHVVILKNESLSNYYAVKEYLRSQAFLYPRGSMEFKGWFATWYTFRDKFAAIKYNYAITCHKAQGSTYTHAIVANYDINANPLVVERNRIKYTAVTRPRESLYIIV